jgi:hypothetical protein
MYHKAIVVRIEGGRWNKIAVDLNRSILTAAKGAFGHTCGSIETTRRNKDTGGMEWRIPPSLLYPFQAQSVVNCCTIMRFYVACRGPRDTKSMVDREWVRD